VAQKILTVFDALDEREKLKLPDNVQMHEHSWPCRFHIIICGKLFMTNVICLTFTDLWGVPFPWPWFLKRLTKNLEIMKSPPKKKVSVSLFYLY
jgi:hypothetical protein